MNDQLKQRLLGATLVVALAVIFVPMLFDDKDADRDGVVATDEVPPSASGGQEREIALPALPEEEKQQSEAENSQAPKRTGYRIIPLDDTPAANPARAASPPEEAFTAGQAPEEMPTEFGEDEGGLPDELPTRDSPLAKLPRAPGVEPGVPSAPAIGGSTNTAPAVITRSTPESHTTPPKAKSKDTSVSATVAKPKVATPGSPEPKATSRPKAAPVPRAAPPPSRAQTPPSKQTRAPEKSATTRKPNDDGADSSRKQSPSNPGSSAGVESPSPSAGASKSVKVAEAPKSAELPTPVAEKPKSAETKAQVAKPKRSTAKAEPAVEAKTSTPKTKVATVSKSPASSSKPQSGGAWMVRAGSFASESDARTLADKLKGQSFAAYVHKVPSDGGVIYRVHVGPASEKTRAEQTQRRLENTAGIRGVLVERR